MNAVTMPEAASQLGINPNHVLFAARLGRLPEPVGRTADGLLLFDEQKMAKCFGIYAEERSDAVA